MRSFFVALLLCISFCFAQAQQDAEPVTIESTEPRVYEMVDEMPSFIGGDALLMNFLNQNIVYPKVERNKGITGRVFTKFVIYEDGSVNEVLVTRSSGNQALDDEAVRVIKLLPPFKPGRLKGKAVKVYYNIPIKFQLN